MPRHRCSDTGGGNATRWWRISEGEWHVFRHENLSLMGTATTTTLPSAEKIFSKTPIFYTMNQISTGSKSRKPSSYKSSLLQSITKTPVSNVRWGSLELNFFFFLFSFNFFTPMYTYPINTRSPDLLVHLALTCCPPSLQHLYFISCYTIYYTIFF